MNQSRRSLPKQCIAAPAGPTAGITRNDPQGALHLAGPACRNQCSTALRTFHHHTRFGKGHQPTIPSREVPWMHATARPSGAHKQPLLANLLLQRSVVGGKNTIQGCPQHRNGRSVPGQTAAMCCSINPFRKPTDHGPARLGENATQLFSHREAMIRSGPRAHDRNGFAGIDMPEQ